MKPHRARRPLKLEVANNKKDDEANEHVKLFVNKEVKIVYFSYLKRRGIIQNAR